MQTLTQPTILLKPFAESGDKNTLPVTNTDLANPQLADLTNGFPPITSERPDNGGLPPERKDFNALGYLTTSYDWFYQAGGRFTFNSTIADAINGYPLNATLWYTDNSGNTTLLRSTKANNKDNFVTTPSFIGTSWRQEIPALGWNNTWTGSNTFSGSVSLGALATATSPAANDSSTSVATTAWANNTSNNLVHKTGTESIGGSKTFISQLALNAGLKFNNSTQGYITATAQNSAINIGTAPSTNTGYQVNLEDATGGLNHRVGGFVTIYKTNGSTETQIRAYKPDGSGQTQAEVAVIYPASGEPYATCPTPSSITDDSTKIATTAYVKACVPKSVGSSSKPVYTDSDGVITECNLGIPGYSSRVTFSTDSYTPTENGLIIVRAVGSNSKSMAAILYANIPVARSECADSSGSTQVIWAFVRKGNTYTISGTGTLTRWFVPLN